MFQKLKDKITEEVKSSPQRIQQFTQSVTEKIQSTSNDDNLFTITDDDSATNSNMEPGFSNVALTDNSNLDRKRTTSMSSLASDISFLPRYESNFNAYHLQSDLDVSTSEIEDNMSSTSSQLGQVTKEQVYLAFQKAQMRYHKYRGRYTDLANHYKELERENSKMKSVLVDTQDKAIRRVAELKEQCTLEQNAKAHLENALRIELDEREYVINTLKTKVDLLQNVKTENLIDLNNKKDEENLELLTKYLNDARLEIENLNGKIQEHKANTIVLQSKTTEHKQKIFELEKLLETKNKEIESVFSREKENNLIIAETKMELHAEIQNKDLEIANLKKELEQLNQQMKLLDNKDKTSKLENLQTQNTKLIEKIENLSQKCCNNESELLKVEQYKIEIKNLNDTINSLKTTNEHLIREKQIEATSTQNYKKTKEDYESLQESYGKLQVECQENIKKIADLRDEIEILINKLTKYNELSLENKTLQASVLRMEKTVEECERENKVLSDTRNDLLKTKEELEINVQNANETIQKNRDEMKQSLLQLETKIKAKLTKDFTEKETKLKTDFQIKLDEVSSNELTTKELQIKLVDRENELSNISKNVLDLENKFENNKTKYTDLENNHLELINENNQNLSKIKGINATIEELQKHLESKDVNIKMLQEEVELLQQVSTDQQNKICDMEKERLSLKQLEDISGKYEIVATENKNLLSKIESANNEIAQLNESKVNMLKELAVLKEENMNQAADNNTENHKLVQECMQLKTENTDLAEKCSNLYNDLQLKEDAIQLKDSELSNYKHDYENMKMQIEAIETEKQTNLDNFKSLQDKLQLQQEEINNLNTTIKNIEQDLLNETMKSKQLLTDNQEREKTIVELKQQNEEIMTELKKSTDSTNDELRLLKQLEEYKNKESALKDEMDNLKKQITDLQIYETKYTNLLDENSNLKETYATTNEALTKTSNEQLQQINMLKDEVGMLNQECEIMSSNKIISEQNYNELQKEVLELQLNQNKLNLELSTKYQTAIEENAALSLNLDEVNLKLSTLNDQLANLVLANATLLTEKEELLIKTNLTQLDNNTEEDLKKQLNNLEIQFNELQHEKQLLLDEIQELKTAPINTNIKDDSVEIERLHEKIQQYKSLDLTNRTSIDFYENELEKLKNKNENLNRKLDETLVTLQHCTELSHSTEVEYLRNVLYNYMLGKESLVLARVIAAVCKFDPEQTENILQREQQKQTLLGQLGIL